MPFVTRIVDAITLGSDHPLRRLMGYYAVLVLLTIGLHFLTPQFSRLFFDNPQGSSPETPFMLQDGLVGGASGDASTTTMAQLLLLTAVTLVGTVLVMLPVTWVYMSAREVRGHNAMLVQTLLILPIVVTGIVFVVRNSLALAFSLAGVVAAVRFRTTLRDTRDVVFIFLAISVGFAAGVYMLGLAALVSMFFNFVVLLTWRFGFGRNVLAPTAASQWKEPLSSLAKSNGSTEVPDRDVLLALDSGRVKALAERFARVRKMMGRNNRRPKYNAVVFVTADDVSAAQQRVEYALTQCTRRWVLDEIVSHVGKPSEMYYLVRLSKGSNGDDVVTSVRGTAVGVIAAVELQLADSFTQKEESA
ncbi:MAG: DUF4956 domain-containing protein [Gemmatimonadaceae bacterium]